MHHRSSSRLSPSSPFRPQGCWSQSDLNVNGFPNTLPSLPPSSFELLSFSFPSFGSWVLSVVTITARQDADLKPCVRQPSVASSFLYWWLPRLLSPRGLPLSVADLLLLVLRSTPCRGEFCFFPTPHLVVLYLRREKKGSSLLDLFNILTVQSVHALEYCQPFYIGSSAFRWEAYFSLG